MAYPQAASWCYWLDSFCKPKPNRIISSPKLAIKGASDKINNIIIHGTVLPASGFYNERSCIGAV